jgi:hypothetical protein
VTKRNSYHAGFRLGLEFQTGYHAGFRLGLEFQTGYHAGFRLGLEFQTGYHAGFRLGLELAKSPTVSDHFHCKYVINPVYLTSSFFRFNLPQEDPTVKTSHYKACYIFLAMHLLLQEVREQWSSTRGDISQYVVHERSSQTLHYSIVTCVAGYGVGTAGEIEEDIHILECGPNKTSV